MLQFPPFQTCERPCRPAAGLCVHLAFCKYSVLLTLHVQSCLPTASHLGPGRRPSSFEFPTRMLAAHACVRVRSNTQHTSGHSCGGALPRPGRTRASPAAFRVAAPRAPRRDGRAHRPSPRASPSAALRRLHCSAHRGAATPIEALPPAAPAHDPHPPAAPVLAAAQPAPGTHRRRRGSVDAGRPAGARSSPAQGRRVAARLRPARGDTAAAEERPGAADRGAPEPSAVAASSAGGRRGLGTAAGCPTDQCARRKACGKRDTRYAAALRAQYREPPHPPGATARRASSTRVLCRQTNATTSDSNPGGAARRPACGLAQAPRRGSLPARPEAVTDRLSESARGPTGQPPSKPPSRRTAVSALRRDGGSRQVSQRGAPCPGRRTPWRSTRRAPAPPDRHGI